MGKQKPSGSGGQGPQKPPRTPPVQHKPKKITSNDKSPNKKTRLNG